jgi:ribonuclease PH
MCVDLSHLEMSSGGAYLPVAVKSSSGEVVYLQLDSRLSLDQLAEAVDQAKRGCGQVRLALQAAIAR